jgi:hypothetical protein
MIANRPMSGSAEKRRDGMIPTALASVTLALTLTAVNTGYSCEVSGIHSSDYA